MNEFIPRTFAGIEIVGGDLRIAIMRSSFGKLELVGTNAVEGIVQMDPQAKKNALSKIVERRQLKGVRVFLSLPQDSGVLKQLDFPVEAAEDVRAAVGLQLENLSPWPVDDVYWDVAWTKPSRGDRRVRVTVAIATRLALDEWVQMLASAGLSVTGASVAPLLWGQATARLWGDAEAMMILSLQTGYAEGALIQGEKIVASRVTEGVPQAERARRVALELTRIGRVSSPDQVRVISYGQETDGLDSDNARLPIEGTTGESVQAFGAIAAALGGLVRGGSFALNLVPEALRYRSNQLQLVPTYVGLALLLVALTVLFVREPYQWTIYAAELDDSISAVAAEAGELTNQESELNDLSDRYRALRAHSGGDATLEAMGTLARVLPFDTWLTSFSLDGSRITIAGFSSGAAELQRLVEETALFTNGGFISSVVRDERGRDQCTLRFNVEDPS